MESTAETLSDKMAKLKALADAIERAKAMVVKHKTPDCAIALQKLQQQRASLRATLPRLKLASG